MSQWKIKMFITRRRLGNNVDERKSALVFREIAVRFGK
jgi:hypothetical protein